MSSQSFSPHLRIRQQADYRRVFQNGIHAADATLVVLGCPNQLGYSRLGLTVSRKVGNAVVRNSWKRRIRDAFRRQQSNLPAGWDLVVRPRQGARLRHAEIFHSLARLAEKIVQRYDQQQSSSGRSS